MIVSASRRTDIPAAHAEWFFRRLREGYALVRNPMNPRSVSRVSLAREDVDGIVFWSKDPSPMLGRLRELDGYAFYFQYTLNAYGRDVEANLPSLAARVETFLRLADALGPGRALWRYDPILLSPRYPAEWHLESFARLAEALRGATELATISFVDAYARNKKRLDALGAQPASLPQMRALAAEIAAIARQNGMSAAACCEPDGLRDCGVAPARCVDAARLGRIAGTPMREARDANQRAGCGCAPSVDVGAYNTCPNGCAYCYANYSPARLRANLALCDAGSPLLLGALGPGDRVSARKMPSLRAGGAEPSPGDGERPFPPA